jgi:Plasmid encoded RepA protein
MGITLADCPWLTTHTSTRHSIASNVAGMALNLKPQKANEQEHPDLFGEATTIHDVVTTVGPKDAIDAAWREVSKPNPRSLPRALAGRSGRQIADSASAALIRGLEGAGEIGYSYSAWCLAGLPHRDTPPGTSWLIETDFARLLVRPGVRLRDDNSEEFLRVPSGSLARLLLVDWQTEALERGSREIVMGRSTSAIAARLGAKRSGPTNTRIADQLERMATCAVDFTFGSDRKGVIVNQRLVEAFEYCQNPDPRAKNRIVERVILTQAFYEELRRHPVVVDKAAIRDLSASPLAIDVYLWLSFRLHSLTKSTPVPWEKLWRQFGPKVGLLKNFRPQFEAPLHHALSTYPGARVRIGDRGLILEPSPPPVSR